MDALATVVIPVLDGARFLPDALASVAEQDLALEVVVVDDGSTDDSAQIAQGTLARDLGVTCLRQPNRGPAAARNAGIAASHAPLVTFLDVDDLIPPGVLAHQMAHLESRPEVDGVMGMQENRVLDDAALPDWAVTDRVGGPDEVRRPGVMTGLFRRTAFERFGVFEERLRLSEDVDWLMRVNDQGGVVDVVDEIMRVRRIHGANLTYDTEGLRRSMFEVLAERARRKRVGS